MQNLSSQPRTVAVLGPTNTGKTYLALERMLAHGSGMMGFPLRLLARENYDRAVALKGSREIALITGEEKIVSPYAKYFFCTVESMPLDQQFAFVAVDEIQLAADPERGHVFTDRLLRARGTEETMFMGSDTMRSMIRRLVPEAEFISRPRFSTLSFTGTKRILRLPPRSVVVGFSAQEVYTIAELIRRERGGAAVVMGALSPRTRNAQVALFQNGEVDYLVATDAIGMGLNLDVDHVAFAKLSKFDGTHHRDLRADELAQIAGRAGRHMSDGTFGLTGEASALDPTLIARIEAHEFQKLRHIYWRNPNLDFSSLDTLAESLALEPTQSGLTRAPKARDEETLDKLLEDDQVRAKASSRSRIGLLWQVCQIPDYNQIGGGHFTGLISRIYGLLVDQGSLPVDWVAVQVAHIDNMDGGIDALVQRIADIRTWTYISHHENWIENAAEWQERTRDIENRLSDMLHNALTQRFVDERMATLVRRLEGGGDLYAHLTDDGEVMVEGHYVGRLEGFKFIADAAEGTTNERAVSTAAHRALAFETKARIQALDAAADTDITWQGDGKIFWRGAMVARVVPGADTLRPRATLAAGDLLDGADRQHVEDRLNRWLAAEIERLLGPLVRAHRGQLSGKLRGIVFQLAEGLGAVPRSNMETLVAGLGREDFSSLRRLGIWVGKRDIYFDAMIRPKPARLCALLWAIHYGLAPIPDTPPEGRVSVRDDPKWPPGFLYAAGYRKAGPLALRLDIAERLMVSMEGMCKSGSQDLGPELLNLAGCTISEFEGVATALGFRFRRDGDKATIQRRQHKSPHRKKAAKKRKADKARARPVDPNSPFAKLKDLVLDP
ncbi:MAG: hypothetical protein HQ503_07310 [Rhodospirillales bacterium]|nr:hypothetical protein [Rhodospirillales bacterium]